MIKTNKKIHTDERGYIVVETVGAFIPFILLVISILSLVNIVTLQARVHYALTQTANSLSMYSYTLEVLGVAEKMTALDNKADRVAGEVNAMKGDIESVMKGVNSVSDVGGFTQSLGNVADRAYEWGEKAIADPKEVLGLLMSYGLNEFKNKAFEELARPMVGRYLSNGRMTGDQYLQSAGVINKENGRTGVSAISFGKTVSGDQGNSEFINKDGNIKLVAQYEVLYTFGGLPLPFKPTLKISQTVVTKVWLNGSGKGYW